MDWPHHPTHLLQGTPQHTAHEVEVPAQIKLLTLCHTLNKLDHSWNVGKVA